MDKPTITDTADLLPFDRLSPRSFERLCLWVANREGFEWAEYVGATGSEQGRDFIARREGEEWIFQCKRVQRFSTMHALAEVQRVVSLPSDRHPSGIVFLTTCNVLASTRNQVRTRCEEVGLECEFWSPVELDARVKQHPDLVEEFFSLAPKRRKVVDEELRRKVVQDAKGVCSICGRVGVPLEIRHLVSVSSGGTDTYENLQAVCRSCHILMDGLGVDLQEARELASSAYWLESLVTRVLRDAGFAVIAGVTGPDAGVDIVAQIAEPGTKEVSTLLVECRGGRAELDSTAVTAFAVKLKQYDGDFGVIVSNEDPTREALDIARNFAISIVSEEQFPAFARNLQGGDRGC